MARAAILREISGVFDAYKIDVNIRHLELIADYMVCPPMSAVVIRDTDDRLQTFDGGYKPFNRMGIASNPSPLLKASYETTAAFLSDATLYGDFDDLTTPSGNVVLGRPNLTGTGVFDVIMPVDEESADTRFQSQKVFSNTYIAFHPNYYCVYWLRDHSSALLRRLLGFLQRQPVSM